MEAAVCATVDPEVFFPVAKVHTRKAYMQNLRTAQAVCSSCPVVAECAGYAIEHGIRWGVWGGLDMEQLPRHIRVRWANA
mgnify:CR=1 FL=1